MAPLKNNNYLGTKFAIFGKSFTKYSFRKSRFILLKDLFKKWATAGLFLLLFVIFSLQFQ